MSMLDKLKGMLKGHESQARHGVEKGGDYVDRKTGGKYTGQVDTGQKKINEQLGTQEQPPSGETRPPQP